MSEIIKKYKKNELEVVWKPGKCSHSGVCAKSLGDVFNPKRRPWIDLDASDAESIVETVRSCPSGALSLGNSDASADTPGGISSDAKSVSGRVIENGPLLVKGEITITLADGKERSVKNAAICRCGASQNKPFCDGSHSKINFEG